MILPSEPRKKVFILGWGWLGRAFGHALLHHGHQVLASSRKRSSSFDPLIKWDLTNSPIPRAIKDFAPEVVIICIPPPKEDADSTLSACQELLALPSLQQGIYTSSTGVYSPSSSLIDESSALDEESPKAIFMSKMEQEILNTKRGVALRLSGLAGAGRHPGFFLSGKLEVKNGHQQVNLIHLQDCLGILELVMQKPEIKGVFNCKSNFSPLKNEFYAKFCHDRGLPEVSFTKSDALGKRISNEKLKNVYKYDYIQADPFEFPL